MGEGRRGALARRCISCDARTFEDYKQLREQQILNELLKKLDLPAKPNITADLDSPLIPMLGHNNSQVQALIEQTLRERRKQRVKKSVTSRKGGLEGTSGEGINYFPALYETNPEVAQQTSYVLAEQSMFEEVTWLRTYRAGCFSTTIYLGWQRVGLLHSFAHFAAEVHF
jgi:hypothetical protein